MPRHPIGDRAMTAAERQRRRRERLHAKPVTKTVTQPEPAELVEARAEIVALKAELTLKPGPAPLPRTAEEWLAAKAAATAERKAKRAANKALAAEIYADYDEPTLQEKLLNAEKQSAAKSTRIKTLMAERRTTHDWYERKQPGVMPFDTFGKVSRCLRQDHGEAPTAAELDEALKLLNAWRSGERKATLKTEEDA